MSAAARASDGAGRRLSRSPAETEALGEALAPALEVGDVIVLTGPLGAGKTCFVAGLARGLACAARVRSPSFTLVNEYRGRLLLLHLDLYRVHAAAAEGLGIDEQAERGVLVAEWGEKLSDGLREHALAIEFTIASEHERGLVARAGSEPESARAAALLGAWRALPASVSGAGA